MLRVTYALLSLLLLSPLTIDCRVAHLNGTEEKSDGDKKSTPLLDEHGRRIIEGILYSDSVQFSRDQSNRLLHFAPAQVDTSTLLDEVQYLSSERKGDFYIDSLTTITPGESAGKQAAPVRSTSEWDLESAASELVAVPLSNATTSLDRLNSTFIHIFQSPRDSTSRHAEWKEKAQSDILKHMHDSSLETKTHPFVVKKGSRDAYDGMNLVGILPGRYYGQKGKDSLIVVGAHYDTVDSVAGIVDNASGVVAVLELARLLAAKPKLNHTIMFVAFDHEEKGLVGSRAFVNEFLIPNVLKKDNVRFIAAYLIDMALTYDPTPESQYLTADIKASCPAMTAKIAKDGNRGDFVAVWLRKNVDYPLYEALQAEWTGFPKYKLRALDPPLPATKPEKWQLLTMSTFTRSDHASFWYHHQDYPTLPAVLVTDLGLWRGDYAECYHKQCDDTRFLTERNLKFFKNTIEVMVRLLSANKQSGQGNPSTGDVPPPPQPPKELQPASTDRSNNRGNGRGPVPRGFRGRGNYLPSDLFPHMPNWPQQFPPLNIPSWARL